MWRCYDGGDGPYSLVLLVSLHLVIPVISDTQKSSITPFSYVDLFSLLQILSPAN